jgi:hypothetical protein
MPRHEGCRVLSDLHSQDKPSDRKAQEIVVSTVFSDERHQARSAFHSGDFMWKIIGKLDN